MGTIFPMSDQRFAIAPTAGTFKGLTTVLLALPVVLLAVGFYFVFAGNAQTGVGMGGTAGFLLFIYTLVWVYYRPSYFELTSEGLLIKWPIRQRLIPYSKISDPEVMSYDGFKQRYGDGMRVGAGGLWGGFGLFVCKKVTFNFYITTLEGIVVAQVDPRPLMITPERAEQFAKALQAKVK